MKKSSAHSLTDTCQIFTKLQNSFIRQVTFNTNLQVNKKAVALTSYIWSRSAINKEVYHMTELFQHMNLLLNPVFICIISSNRDSQNYICQR